MTGSATQHSRPRKTRTAWFETLESRLLLATVSVNVNQTVRSADPQLLGLNIATWDGNLSTSQTAQMVQAMGTTAVRLPGGSTVDDNWHFNVNNQNQTIGQMANFIASINGVGVVSVNYGTGSPQEAAALLAYLNGSPSSTVSLGMGEQWNTSTSSWQNVNWQTAGYWASLRAATPISGNPDGLNFLRLGRAAPFGLHYWEMGNEIYGSWEMDEHGTGGDTLPMPAGATSAAHDPTTYVSFAKQFAALAAQIDPTISIGLASQGTDTEFNDWIVNLLKQCAAQGFTPGFISDHLYDQQPGQENDTTLLSDPSKRVTPTPANPLDWSQRAQAYRTLLNTYLGSAAPNVELLATEINSVSSDPGKQMTSLVNGIFIADSVGELMQTEYNGAWIWDLHNSYDTTQNDSASLYGWRSGGDYGVLGTSGTKPASGLNVPYPNYFAEELAAKIVQSGGTVVSASSSDSNLDVFAVKEPNGHLELLVVNKSLTGLNLNGTGPTNVNSPPSISGTFTLTGFTAGEQAQFWQYGWQQDNAQRTSSNGASALANFSQTLSYSNGTFNISFPGLSMTVVDLSPATAPVVTGSAYAYNTSPNQIQFTFDQDMLSSSIVAGDLQLTNLSGGAVPAVQSVQWNSSTKIATFTLAPGALANGNYTATLPAGSVSSAPGLANAAGFTLDFFSLAADTNHDGIVSTADFTTLAANFNKTGMTFSQGDFNYDGVVNALDFAILASQYGSALSSPAAPALASATTFSLGSAPLNQPPPDLFAAAPIQSSDGETVLTKESEPMSLLR